MKWKRSAAADDTASRTRTTSPSRARPHLNLMDLVLRTAPPRVRVILTGSLSLSPFCPGIDWQQQKVRRRVDRRGQAIRSLPSARSPCWLVLAVMHRLEDEVMRAALPTAAAADRSAMNNATGECRRSSVTPLILPSADNGSNGRNGARFAALASGLHSQKEEQFSPNKKSLNHATPYIS